ncbi:MAG TPA: bifunctional methylenetetrahydrofolate dehydrogenase/methenyltetrahydrofolate cyclohydrolase FolD [Gemmatimonadaceae bacterium]|nr:bifunctional methylenetetrahydrofolate dehydrogenase/methenyltetrahydrofolate cyclohydrolase FolD [Gemmatimonadaceae bacterium]
MRAETTAVVIDGKEIARRVRERVAEEVKVLKARSGVTPGLTVVLVGDDPASAVYVAAKGRACAEAGMKGDTIRMPATTTQAELVDVVQRLNRDPAVHGILVQMPLPKQIDSDTVLRNIDPAKDVDGFHPINVGKLFIGDPDAFAPCTPSGVMVMLREYGIPTAGKHVVVIGRSMIVGKPMAALLVQPGVDATVTICHSRTKDLADHTRRADIVIAAVGRPEMVTGDMIRPGAAVIDVGINRVDDPSAPKGYRLVGDVHFESARQVASHITPVPGGVGAMTIAMLMDNTLKAATRIADRSSR